MFTKVEQTLLHNQTTNTFGQQKRDPGHKEKKRRLHKCPINIDVTTDVAAPTLLLI